MFMHGFAGSNFGRVRPNLEQMVWYSIRAPNGIHVPPVRARRLQSNASMFNMAMTRRSGRRTSSSAMTVLQMSSIRSC